MSFRERARKITEHPLFDLTVGLLVLVSIGLLAGELVTPPDSPGRALAERLSVAISSIFVVELSLRWVAMRQRRRFLGTYWLDVLSLTPSIPVFRVFRLLTLLRLLRLFRLTSIIHSNSRRLGFLLHRQAADHALLFILIFIAVTFGTLGMEMFEHVHHHDSATLTEAFWTTVFSLFAGEFVHDYPRTVGGKLVSLLIIFCGLSLFAVLTGTISAIMIEKIKEGTAATLMNFEELEGHVVLCGWNSGMESMLVELQSHPAFRDREVVVITERDELPDMPRLPNQAKVRLVREDFTRVEVLERVNVARARVAIIVSDVGQSRTRQDADARTVLAALTIEKLNPEVYTCAELSNAMNESHLRMGHVNQVVISREVTGHLLAQAALHETHLAVLQDLLRPASGSSLISHPPGEFEVGKSFLDVLTPFRERTGCLPIAVRCGESGEIHINPGKREVRQGDLLICIDPEELRERKFLPRGG